VLRPDVTRRLTCGVVVVELRGFEPLTPCMPSRDPRHSDPHETSRSRALHQSRRADAWWFAWLRRAELLRGCCAKWLSTGVDATPRSLARMVIGGSGFGWAMTVTVALARDTMLGRGVARALATTPPQALVAPEVRDALGEADLVVLNLECCISERGRPWTLLASRSSSAPHRERSSCWPCSEPTASPWPTTTPWTTASLRPAGWFSPTPRRRSPTETRGCLAGRTSRRVELPDRQLGPGYVVDIRARVLVLRKITR
jgi:hypothetical protein